MALRLLIVTQKVDHGDSLLGFVHHWLAALSAQCHSLVVICLERGVVELPKNVSVLSLGKEKRRSRILYLFRFFYYVFSERRNYTAVFVHMNPEYVVLGGWFWRLARKKIGLWYNHTYGDWKTRLAMRLSHAVFHTSPYAFTAGTKKSRRMPAGIDTNTFRPYGVEKSSGRKKSDILYLGRISPIKDLKTLLAALKILYSRGKRFTLDIYGDPAFRDARYFEEVKEIAADVQRIASETADLITFISHSEKQPPVVFYRTASVFVNLTPAGNYDKTVLEAAACGCLPVVSSLAFADILPPELFFEEKNPRSLAVVLERVLSMSEEDRRRISTDVQQKIKDRHDLTQLASEVVRIFNSLSLNAPR